MAKPRHGRMSENDTLIELRRLRGELGDVRARMAASSFRHDKPRVEQLRARANMLMLGGLALVVALLCWLLYRLMDSAMGSLFQDLVPHPVPAAVNATIALVRLAACALIGC